MPRWNVSLKTFNAPGTAYLADYEDISAYVEVAGIGKVKEELDPSNFDVGVFKYPSVNLTLRNEDGKFSEVGSNNTIFLSKRINSLIKIEYQGDSDATQAGYVTAGSFNLGPPELIFTGLLNDDSTAQDIKNQKVKFKALGLDSIFSQVEMVQSPTVANGEAISSIIFKGLNQTAITDIITVNAGNINVGRDENIDDVTVFEGQTVKEALDKLLLVTNSILYIENSILIIKKRTETAAVQASFYGQASEIGIENIQNLSDIKTGLNKTFNYLTYDGTGGLAISKDNTSIGDNGIRKKDISYDGITVLAKRQAIIDEIKSEFSLPKKELDVTVVTTVPYLGLNLLDKIDIDYPTVFFSVAGDLPTYSVAKYGEDKYPVAQWALEIPQSTKWKIIGKKIDLINFLITFKIREI